MNVNHKGRLADQRVLITAADAYMGPAIAERFSAEGAAVIEDIGDYEDDIQVPQRAVIAAGRVDVLVVNLPGRARKGAASFMSPAEAQTEEGWRSHFDRIVHPTMRFVTAVLPQMIARRAGKIIVVTSAVPLRAVPLVSAYAAARGAQHAYVKTVGAEIAPHNVQINAIGQNWTIGGYAPDALDNPKIRERLMREVPAQRLSEGSEQAALALFLASQESNFFCGQIFPFAGGWVTT